MLKQASRYANIACRVLEVLTACALLYIAMARNTVTGWDLAADPIELWIAVGVAALLLRGRP